MKGYFYRGDGCALYPADEDTANAMQRTKRDLALRVEWVQDRNILNHRRFFAGLLPVISNNSRVYDNKEKALTFLKYATGHTEDFVNPLTGEVTLIPCSISFEAMPDESDFQAFFSRCIDAVLQYIPELAGHSPAQIDAMVEHVLGFSR